MIGSHRFLIPGQAVFLDSGSPFGAALIPLSFYLFVFVFVFFLGPSSSILYNTAFLLLLLLFFFFFYYYLVLVLCVSASCRGDVQAAAAAGPFLPLHCSAVPR